MPRQPKKRTVLRQIREATGMSQRAFAEEIGVNLHTYRSIEQGRLATSAEMWEKVFQATGAIRASIFVKLDGDADFPVGLCRLSHHGMVAFTTEDYQAWSKELKERRGRPRSKCSPTELAETFSKRVQLLFEAADSVKPSRLTQLYAHLCQALNLARKDFGLEAETNRLLAKQQSKRTFRFTVGQLRRNPPLAAKVKFKDRQYHSDGSLVSNDDKVEVTSVMTPQWNAGFASYHADILWEK